MRWKSKPFPDTIKVMIDTLVLETEKDIRIFSDPLHLKILQSLEDNGPQTSADIARRFGEEAARMHYHMKKMETAGIIEEDHAERINGIRARFMRAAARHYKIGKDKSRGFSDPALADVRRMLASEMDSSLEIIMGRLQELADKEPAAQDPGLDPGKKKNELLGIFSDLELDEQTALRLQDELNALISGYSEISAAEKERRIGMKVDSGNMDGIGVYRLIAVLAKKPQSST